MLRFRQFLSMDANIWPKSPSERNPSGRSAGYRAATSTEVGRGRKTMTNLLYTAEQDARAAALTGGFIRRYADTVADRPVYPEIDREALRALMREPLPEEGRSLDELFAELDAVVVPNSTQTAHPRFLPYVQPSPNGVSPYAEAVAAALNQNCNLWTLSPAANAIEQAVLRWFADLFGFGPTAGGLITSGGSMANLIGLAAARDRHLGETARSEGLQGRPSPLVAYASEEAHSSIDKAVSLLGLGTNNLRHIACDADFRIRLDRLADAVAADRAAGRSPFCVVASAGTVTTGAIDPIEALAAFCRREKLWLHVDGAYGALAALSNRFRGAMAGIGEADSASLDPHKFLFASFEAGCVLVKDVAALRHSFRFAPSYLAMPEDEDFVNFADHGPQLSRGFKALKVWWSLRHHGRRTYGETIDRMADLAAGMAEIARSNRAFELLAPVGFNCVCFRLAHLDDAGNRMVLKRLVASGTAFLGPASVRGRFGMRACFMNLRTTPRDVALIMSEIARLGEQMGEVPVAARGTAAPVAAG
jgi:aromatic-L-amino-acid/L-tryptophan decarboxylase